MNGMIFDIQRSSTVDGPGVRTTVFFKGCNLKCKWCHNPESQSKLPQLLFYSDKCIGCGSCKRICPNAMESCSLCGKCAWICPADARKICGRSRTVDEVYREVEKDRAFYGNSGGGVTFSGGECMLQPDFLCELLKKCRKNGIQTAVDTAGNVSWRSFEKIMPYTDIFLYDIKCYSDDLHKEYTGVSNCLIKENMRKLSRKFKGDLVVRVPIIPGVNDSEEELRNMADFLGSVRCKTIDLLPYHRLGENKYASLGMEHPSYSVPDKERMDYVRKILLG